MVWRCEISMDADEMTASVVVVVGRMKQKTVVSMTKRMAVVEG